MNRRRIIGVLVGMALLLLFPISESMLYTVDEREQAVLLQFGRPVASHTEPGLYFKLPLVQEVLRLPKTMQLWRGISRDERLFDLPLADGKKIEVTVWATWRINDPAQFVRTVRTVANAESRVKEFVLSTARNTITTHNLAELVRSTNRSMSYTLGLPPEMVARAGAAAAGNASGAVRKPGDTEVDQAMLDFIVPPEAKEKISKGRLKITDEIRTEARCALAEDGQGQGGKGRGIELVDVGLAAH